MGIFDSYADKEALLKDIAREITESQNDKGETVYKLQNRDADNYRAKYEAEVKNAKSQREKKQEAEAKLAEALAAREKDAVELESLRALNPADLKATLQKYVDQSAEAAAKIKSLEKELVPLREKTQEYEARETRQKIEAELVENARKLNCCDTAMRDVRRLAPMFHITESGVIMSNDNRLISEVLEAEIQQSPHWLKRSQSAGANPGTTPLSNEARFQQALKGTDFAAVIANAPRQPVQK